MWEKCKQVMILGYMKEKRHCNSKPNETTRGWGVIIVNNQRKLIARRH